MKTFILVTKTDTWHDRQILLEAKKAGVSMRKVDFADRDEFIKTNWDAPVVLWRSSSLGTGIERSWALKELERKGKIIINQGVVHQPEITHKDFQQKKVKTFLEEIRAIPTHVFTNKEGLLAIIKKGELIFPFIKKPDLGAQGEGVVLVEKMGEVKKFVDVEIRGCVFQNFIENDGDYRVLVLGGCPLGVIKRMAKEGGFLNNISQGGTAVAIQDKKIITELTNIAAKIAAVFDLGFCGVDLILNKKTGQFHFLELNTVPQWQGFQKSTKINVAKKVVAHCQRMADRSWNEGNKLIQDFYETTPTLIEEKKFHFYSRLYLWTKNEKYKKELLKLKEYFLGGKTREAWVKKIQVIIADQKKYQKKVINGKNFREASAKKYPLLGVYHELLFRSLLAQSIYRLDWWKVVTKIVPQKKLLALRDELLKNKNDLSALSTFAVNYLFLLSFFVKDVSARKNMEEVLVSTARKIAVDEKRTDLLKNNFYFLTHCIVAGSKFYVQKPALKSGFSKEIIEKAEALLKKNYSKISLDNKLEFLVCAVLVGKKSLLEKKIFTEVNQSFSLIGNFLIDKLNESKKDAGRKDLFSSEHRNVLYLMIKTAFKK